MNREKAIAAIKSALPVCYDEQAAADAVYDAIVAAGLAVVSVEEATRLLGIVADGASDQMYADPDDTEMLDAFNKLSAMIGKAE